MIILKFISGETININKLLSNNIQSLTEQLYKNKKYQSINSEYNQSIISFYLIGGEEVLPFNYKLDMNTDIILFVLYNVVNIEQFDSNAIHHIKNTNNIKNSRDISQALDINIEFSKSNLCDCLGSLIYLQQLYISRSRELISVKPIETLINLKSLVISLCIRLIDITPIQHLFNLKLLYIESCVSLQDITPINKLVKLTDLSLANCRNIYNIESLQNLIELRNLTLSKCININTIESLRYLKNLTILNLNNCYKLISIEPLCNLINLRRLYIKRNITDIYKIYHLKELKIIYSL